MEEMVTIVPVRVATGAVKRVLKRVLLIRAARTVARIAAPVIDYEGCSGLG